MSEHQEVQQEQEQEKSKTGLRHIQTKFTKEEFKEIELWMIHNDISDKNDFVRQLILRKVRGYEPVQTDERLHASQNGDGYDTFR